MIYYIVVITLLFLLLWYILRSLKKLEDHFRGNIEENENFGALRNKPGRFKNIFKRSREKAIKNIGVRFTIIRKTLFVIWLLIVLFSILFPFMGNFSKGVFSLLASTGTIFLGFAAKPFIENAIAGMVITLCWRHYNNKRKLRSGRRYHNDPYYSKIMGLAEICNSKHKYVKRKLCELFPCQ